MLDKPEKTRQLVTALKAAIPFEVELTLEVVAHLRSQENAHAVEARHHKVEHEGIDHGRVGSHQ